MIDNPKIIDGKTQIDGLFHKFLESKGYKVVVDRTGTIGLEGQDLPATDEEIFEQAIEFMLKLLETLPAKEVSTLAETMVDVEVIATQNVITGLRSVPAAELEQTIPAPQPEPEPVAIAEPEPEPAAEGFFSSYYNWIFGTTAKETPKPEQNGPKHKR